ncbi:MAG TPA: prepilin-type N-terminal cleavage/methylation domain-containing protein [Candidatus Tectomicrobia bacterium]|jgi:general secretion pathway protein I
MWNRRPAERLGHAASAGFTLLEVVVALTIVALSLVSLMRLHLLSLDATMRAQDLTTAVQLAQSRMAALGPFPEPGEERGRFDTPELAKFHWQTVVTEHRLEATDSGQLNIELRHIEVTIRWRDGLNERSYTLEAYASQQTSP